MKVFLYFLLLGFHSSLIYSKCTEELFEFNRKSLKKEFHHFLAQDVSSLVKDEEILREKNFCLTVHLAPSSQRKISP